MTLEEGQTALTQEGIRRGREVFGCRLWREGEQRLCIKGAEWTPGQARENRARLPRKWDTERWAEDEVTGENEAWSDPASGQRGEERDQTW